MNKKYKVYVAGPITAPTDAEMLVNVQKAMRVGCELMKHGHSVFVPHTSFFMHNYAKLTGLYQPTWADWIKLDLFMLPGFDVLIRLEGDSRGTDVEVATAELLGIPVFYSADEFLAWTAGVITRQS